MKKKIIAALFTISLTSAHAQSVGDMWNKAKEEVKKDEKKIVEAVKEVVPSKESGVKVPSNEEIIQGLKEALSTGTNKTTATVSKADGYLKNARLFIPFRPKPLK